MPVPTLLTVLALLSQPDAIVESIKANYVPLKAVTAGKGLEDMKALKTTLANVRVVGMGEPTHGSREVFQMKHRMFEFLVEEMGYTVFGLEASMPDCVAMDRYVLTGEGDVNNAVRAQGFWTWSTEEVADLIKWMRKYNQDPAHKTKLRVVGFDMQNRYGAAKFLKEEFAKVGIAPDPILEEALKFPRQELDLKKMDKVVAESLPQVKEQLGAEEAELVKQIGVVFKDAYLNEKGYELGQKYRAKVAPFLMATVEKSGELLKSHPDLKGDALAGMQLLEKSSKTVYDPTDAEQKALRTYSEAVRAYASSAKKDKDDLMKAADVLEYFAVAYENADVMGKNYRDQCMAKNVEWTINTYLPGQKAMLWAHNMHVAKWEQTKNYWWMGAYLNNSLREKYYPVGFSFFEGSFQAMDARMSGLKEWTVEPAEKETLDEVLHRAGSAQFFLDLGKLDPGAKTWFSEPRMSRSIGAVYNPQMAKQFMLSYAPAKLFDGLIFIGKTTRARPLPR